MNSQLLHNCLRRLMPHVDAARIALTGGVAIGVHREVTRGDRTRAVAAEDLDFIADDVSAVRQTATGQFLVSHFHLPQPGYTKFFVQLVDPTTRLRLDIFPDALRALSRASLVDVSGVPLRVVGANDLLDHKLALLSRASASSPIEEKHYADAKCLGAMCGHEVSPLPASHLSRTVFSHDLEQSCVRCHVSQNSAFPLAPKRAIFDILGYV
jgi:hypothetical protein